MIEEIRLNLIPNGVSPVCHVSQYDEGRQIKINLFEGINAYVIQSGDTFTLNVRKPDNTIVTTSVSGTQGNNYITISTTQQIAAVVGENLCELKITNGSTVIGTLNFVMQVERDVLADGIPSQSVIEDLDERIAEAIGDNYYNKTETDALLNNKADKSNTYNKTETDSLLALKADKSNTYTKAETDALLALKADKSELYNVYPTEQESGAIVSFTDGGDNIPMKSLESEIVAVETGNGEKSPTNPYSISGFANGIVSVCGVNIWDEVSERGYYDASGNFVSSNAQICSKNLIPVKPNTDYYFCGDIQRGGRFCYYDASGNFINRSDLINNMTNRTFTIPNGVYYIKFHLDYPADYNNNLSINYPSTDTQYHAYNGNTYTFAFGQTVYGGHFDNKGELESDMAIKDTFVQSQIDKYDAWGSDNVFAIGISDASTDSEIGLRMIMSNYQADTQANILNGRNTGFWYRASYKTVYICDLRYTTVLDFYNAITSENLKICYPLATPITLSITSQNIPTLSGVNNIFSNTGDVDVTIRADIGLYIDKRLNVSRSTPNNLIRAASYVDEPESVNETQEDSVEPQVDTQENNEER